jgi:hypothetical protein
MAKAAIKVGHHVCIVCGRPFTRPYSARRHVVLKHQGYGQITSLTEYILGLAQGRYPMPTYTLPKAQQITTGEWSSNYRQGRNSIESWVKSWADYSDDLLRLGRNLKMISPNTLPNSYYYYYYHDPARQRTTTIPPPTSAAAIPTATSHPHRDDLMPPPPPFDSAMSGLRRTTIPTKNAFQSRSYSFQQQKEQEKPKHDSIDGTTTATAVATNTHSISQKPGSKFTTRKQEKCFFALYRHEADEKGSGIGVHWVLYLDYDIMNIDSEIEGWCFLQDPTRSLTNASHTSPIHHGTEDKLPPLQARLLRNFRYQRSLFVLMNSDGLTECCRTQSQTLLDAGTFRLEESSFKDGKRVVDIKGIRYSARCRITLLSGKKPNLWQVVVVGLP